MVNAQLLKVLTCNQSIAIDWVKAEFIKSFDWSYNVELCVNSQKFFLNLTSDNWSIQSFEVLSAKWFVGNLTNGLIITLRNLVQSLMLKL